MILIFRRTGQRRYAVEVKRPPHPDVEMNPAPGYDALMPHDLMHLVVEAQLGLTHGIFGQLAAGGDAGTFHLIMKQEWPSRTGARIRRRLKTKGTALLRAGRDDCAQSERATFICWQDWLARSQSGDRRASAGSMAAQSKQVRDTASPDELHTLNNQKLDQICRQLDRLSLSWSTLEIGQSIAVRWPDLAVLPRDAIPLHV